ncbi:polysaccharide deacetylase family protein [Ferrimonas lipolytica]|uniref:Polysaccharide deacetylase family protein n=1 Tax=Ferrimonas lipolytica TaxID=2724191 RepID=A0A6H1UJK1_9GAMM|nr:polysaccharide deacetylase family protein [Ferrimonas lipolytica]QIZ78396.1 polysaccharide deacetylase family protein [Ferrimonas lipolytica]
MKKICLALLCGALLQFSSLAQAVVILQYHHVSETTPETTSVTPAQFTEQMTYLADHGFTVVPLQLALNAIAEKRPLAEKSVVISFDDGYQNVADNAHPLLRQLGFPYTVFINVKAVEQQRRNVMSWQTLRQLANEGATIANHSFQHDHLIRLQVDEDLASWQVRVQQDIENSQNKIVEEIGHNVKVLAYPYGEFNPPLRELLTSMGYAGLGQHSGAAGPYSDITALPRYPVAGPYADINTLKVKMHSLNMPVLALDGAGSQLLNRAQPSLTVTLDSSDVRTQELMCYIQGQGAKVPTWLDDSTFTIQADMPLPVGRSRYNCTAPSKSKNGYYWFSQPWIQANSDGSWPAE